MLCRTFVAAAFLLPTVCGQWHHAALALAGEGDEAFAKAATYRAGETRQWILAVERSVREAGGRRNPGTRSTSNMSPDSVEQRLLGLLGNAQATKDAKAFACEQLSVIGSAAAVPALSALLADEALHHAARMALERIQDDAAGAALRDALSKLNGKLLVGVINSLGERRDAQAVAALAKLTGGASAEVTQAAVWALGRIGGPDAAKALVAAGNPGTRSTSNMSPDSVWTDACVSCADALLQSGKKDDAGTLYRLLVVPARPTHVRLAGLRGLGATSPDEGAAKVAEALKGDDARFRIAAASLVAGIPGEAATKAFAAEFPAMPPPVQVILLGAFAARGDRGALPTVTNALQSTDAGVRLAALKALAQLDATSAVPVLLERAAKGDKDEQKVAREGLAELRGEGIERAVLAQIESPTPAIRVEVIRALAANRTPGAVPAVAKAARDADESVRIAALDAMGSLSGEAEVPALLTLLTNAASAAERRAAEGALCAAIARLPNAEGAAGPVFEAVGRAPAQLRGPLLRALACTKSKKALETIRAAAGDERAEVKDAAIRALVDWPDASPAADVLAIAQNAKEPAHRILALRGYARMAGLENVPAAERLAMCEKAFGLATRVEEKRLVLGALASVPSLEALVLAEKHLEDADLKTETAAACVRIASAVHGKHPAEAKAALQKVLKVLPEGKVNERVRQDARNALKNPGAGNAKPAPRKDSDL